MDSMADWIAPLIEGSVSSCLSKTTDTTLHVEDDGSNLRFADHSPRRALIVDV